MDQRLSAPLWLLLLALAALALDCAHGHVYLQYPPSRGMALTPDDYLRSAYNGLRGWNGATEDSICGDGGQSTTQGDRSLWSFGKRGTPTRLTAGSQVTFSVRVRVWHKGRFEFRICQYRGAETTATLNQACLDQRVLQPASGQSRVISGDPGFWFGDKSGIEFTTETMNYIIPSDLSCDGVNSFCVLQFQYVTGNSCNPPGRSCPAGFPGFCPNFVTCRLSPPTGEYFRNCADITVQGGTVTPTPSPPRPRPSPPPSPKTPQTPPAGGGCGGGGKPTTQPGGQCGSNTLACPNGQCCSKWGWCGTTNDHCAAASGCQRNFGCCR